MAVYFIQDINGGPIKIGYANHSPYKRIATIQREYPKLKLRILKIIDGDIYAEHRLHSVFGAFRLHGEWFDPSPSLLEFISEVEGIDYPPVRSGKCHWLIGLHKRCSGKAAYGQFCERHINSAAALGLDDVVSIVAD